MRSCPALSFVFAVAAVVAAEQAFAAQRTFVASTGSDANACSLALPCRSFTTAMAQTSANGDIVVLDSAGYGGVTITQSVNIIAPPGVYAGVTVLGGSAIIVNAPGSRVLLRGLTINGAIQSGINYIDGTELTVEDCTIAEFATGIAGLAPNGRLVVRNTVIRNAGVYGIRLKGGNVAPIEVVMNGLLVDGAGTYGAYIQGAVRARLVDSAFLKSAGQAIYISPDLGLYANRTTVEIVRTIAAESQTGVDIVVATGNSTAEVMVRESHVASNSAGGIRMNTSVASGAARLAITDTQIYLNGTDGFSVQNGGVGFSLTVMTRNVITRNVDNGIFVGSNATLRTAGDNRVDSNPGGDVLGSGTITTFNGF